MSNVVALKPKVTIGGSEAAAAAGIDPYRSRVGLWLVKTGRVPEPEESEAMRWGKRLEDDIDEALRERGFHVADSPHFKPRELSDSDRPWLIGHPDGYVGIGDDFGVLERKTVGQWARREWNGHEPAHYAAQVQHYLHLTGLDRGLLAVLVGGQRLETYTIQRDQRAIDLLLQLEEEFVGYVTRDEPPPVRHDDSDNVARFAELMGASETPMRLGRRTLWPVLQEIRTMDEQMKALKRQREERANRIKLEMAKRGATVAIDPWDNECARYTPRTDHRVDVARLREERPDVAAEFVKETETRRFTVL